MNDHILAGTGHRPPRLGLGYDSNSNRLLTEFAKSLLVNGGPSEVVSGMAQGWDMALAHAAILLGIPLTCAIPFDGQESRWPADSQRRYNAILGKARHVEIVCKGSYSPSKFITRDRWMVDRADAVLALWDKQEKGGTFQTVKYAIDNDVKVVNVWCAWERFSAQNGVVTTRMAPEV